jgi:hypothetical protein
MTAPNFFFQIIAVDNYSQAFNDLNKKIDEFSKKHSQAAKNITKNNNEIALANQRVVKSIKNIVGAYATIATLKKAFHDFAYFDKYIQKIGIIQHISGKALGDIKKDIIDISRATGGSVIELSKAGVVLASAKIDVSQYKDFLKAIEDVKGLAGGRELDESEIATMMAVMKKNFPNAEANDMADTIGWMLDKVKSITFLELSNSLGRSAEKAKALNISMNELLAVESGNIVDIGGAQASTKMSNLLQILRAKKNNIAKEMQIDINFEQPGALLKFLNDVKFKYSLIDDEQQKIASLEKIFGKGDIITSLLSYLDNLDNINVLYTDLKNAKGFAAESAKKLDNTPYQNLKKISNEISLSFISIGEILSELSIPQAFLTGLQYINKLLHGISNVVKGVKASQGNGSMTRLLDKVHNVFFKPTNEVSLSDNFSNLDTLSKNKAFIGDNKTTLDTTALQKVNTMPNAKIDNQEIKITLDNKGNVPISIVDTKTDNNNSKVKIQQRNFLNR